MGRLGYQALHKFFLPQANATHSFGDPEQYTPRRCFATPRGPRTILLFAYGEKIGVTEFSTSTQQDYSQRMRAQKLLEPFYLAVGIQVAFIVAAPELYQRRIRS